MRFIEEFKMDLTKTKDFLEWTKMNNEECILNREDDTKWLRRMNITFDNYHSEIDKIIKSLSDPSDRERQLKELGYPTDTSIESLIGSLMESKRDVYSLKDLYDERIVIDELVDYYVEEVEDVQFRFPMMNNLHSEDERKLNEDAA